MKYKPFEAVETITDGMNFFGDFVEGKRPSRPCICERRCGVEVRVIPRINGTWDWGVWQFGGKYKNGWKYSNYTRRSYEGVVSTFEEGQRIVTDMYKEIMEEFK
ncbi:MAG: hypothetical protein EOM15_12910 [Spirochaetia bacterium]|nr:hypothetical protein [Spirochaetia bacterium]